MIASLQKYINNSLLRNTVRELSPEGELLSTYVGKEFDSNQDNTGVIIGMDADVTAGYLYFGDRNNTGLYRVKLEDNVNSDNREIVVSNVIIWGVAYDWVNQYVYWTEDG